MGHVTNGLTLAFSHLVWAKRKNTREETQRECMSKRPCRKSTSQGKKLYPYI